MFNIVAVGFLGDDITAKRHTVRLLRVQIRTDYKYATLGEAHHDAIEEEELPPAG